MVALTMNRMVAMRGSRLRVASRLVDEADLHAAVVAAPVVDLEDAHGARAARGRQVRAAPPLAVEPHALDDPPPAGRRGGRPPPAAAGPAPLPPRPGRGGGG